MQQVKDWESKEELRENLAAMDPNVASLILSLIKGNTLQFADNSPIPVGSTPILTVTMTQAAYDALPVKDPQILFVTTA